METSTPLTSRHRHMDVITLGDSSIDSPGEDMSTSMSLELDKYQQCGERTGMSPRMNGLKVTPARSNTSSQLDRELVSGAGDLSS